MKIVIIGNRNHDLIVADRHADRSSNEGVNCQLNIKNNSIKPTYLFYTKCIMFMFSKHWVPNLGFISNFQFKEI